MKWKLIEVEPLEWKQDKSGFYCLINVIESRGDIRVDLMTSTDSPAVSFQGKPADVRKYLARYTEQHGLMLSAEHMAYIGYEIARAEYFGTEYVQD